MQKQSEALLYLQCNILCRGDRIVPNSSPLDPNRFESALGTEQEDEQ